MKLKVQEAKLFENGAHTGKIKDIIYIDEPYAYVRILIESEGGEIAVSYPQNVSNVSMLGDLLKRFGAKLKIGEEVSPEEYLTKGKEVEFMTMSKKGKDEREYANIIRESLQPKK